MHSYPAWKIWLVVIVLLAGTVLALPNVFGEAPALQLSRNDRTAVTDAQRQQVVSLLQSKDVTVENSYLEGDRLVLRFDDVSTRLKARDIVQQGTADEYLVALSDVPRTPGWMRALGLKPMSLGLDLRGGVYFMYEVDAQGAVKQLLTSMESDYRTMLRKERIPFTGVASDGVDTVRIGLRSGDDAERFASLLRKQDPNLSVDTDTLGEGGSVTVSLSPTQIKQRQDFAIQQNITTLRNRVDELGVTEPIVARQGLDRIVVQLPGVQDPNEALRVLGATATLEFRLVDEQNDAVACRQHEACAARHEALPHARWPSGPAQARNDRLGRAAHGCQLRLPAGRTRGHGHARCARRVEDARDHAPEPRQAHGGRVHREEARGRRPALQGHPRGQRMHRGGGHQPGHHPRRVRQQFPDHGRDGQRGA